MLDCGVCTNSHKNIPCGKVTFSSSLSLYGEKCECEPSIRELRLNRTVIYAGTDREIWFAGTRWASQHANSDVSVGRCANGESVEVIFGAISATCNIKRS